MKRSAEFWRGADWQWVHGATRAHIAEELAAAEAREAFPIPDTLPEVPEARETGESDSIKLAKLIDGMFYCEGGGYDSDDVREGIQKAFEIGVQSAGKTEAREAGEPKGIAAWLTDSHVRTKDGKLCCVEVRRPDTHGGMACTWKMKDFDIQAEMDGCEVGEEIVLRYVELTDAEFTALGDFDGW
jgi:hypothetical protein